jgi:hypothetical protein
MTTAITADTTWHTVMIALHTAIVRVGAYLRAPAAAPAGALVAAGGCGKLGRVRPAAAGGCGRLRAAAGTLVGTARRCGRLRAAAGGCGRLRTGG